MKFLEYTPFTRINGFLNNCDLGHMRIKGCVEAYSCKLAGFDKRLSRSIEQDVLENLEFSPDSSSTVGPLTSLSSRRTLINLVLALSHMYPDYDFSKLRPQHFRKEDNLDAVFVNIRTHLYEAIQAWWSFEAGEGSSIVDEIRKAIDEVVNIQECEVYSLPFERHPLMNERSCLWAFNYFFYNKKLKRILYFGAQCFVKSGTGGDDISVDEEEAVYDDDHEVQVFQMECDDDDRLE